MTTTLRSRERAIFEATIGMCRSYGDNLFHCHGEQADRQFNAIIAKIDAALAADQSPEPGEGELPPCPKCGYPVIKTPSGLQVCCASIVGCGYTNTLAQHLSPPAAPEKPPRTKAGTNYVCDREVAPRVAFFENGRVVSIKHTIEGEPYLEIEMKDNLPVVNAPTPPPADGTQAKYLRSIIGCTADGGRDCLSVDVYDVLRAFNVTDPALQHAIKKCLLAGERGHKDRATDLREAIESIRRAN